MIFYETEHKSIENKEIEERLDKERRHCKEKMFDYNHCRPDDRPAFITYAISICPIDF